MFRSLLALTLSAALLSAQGGPGAERPRPEPGDPAFRAHLIARLNDIRAERIKASLGLPAPLAKTITDRWGQFDLETHDRRQGLRAAKQKVQDILLGPGSDDEKNQRIAQPLAQFAQLQKQQRDARERFEADLQRLLTPIQQGRFLILLEDFQRRMTEAMPESHRGRQ